MIPAHDKRGATGMWPTYHLFGLTLASDFPFANRLAPGNGPPDLTFTCVQQAPYASDLAAMQPAYTSPYYNAAGKSNLALYRQSDCDVLRFADIADFYLWPHRIVCHPSGTADVTLVEILLLGVVLSFWLERAGVLTLHASAVAVEGHVAAFIATNTGGKSSLAAILTQAGYPLLSDDMLAVEQCSGRFMGRPGCPEMRLWPDQAEYFLGHYWRHLDKVVPAYAKRRVPVGLDGVGTFCDTSKPLGCFYLPARRDPSTWGVGIEITPVPPQDGLIELVRHSFTPNIVEARGLQPKRLQLLAAIACQVPIRQVIYPSSREHFPLVRQALLTDLANR